MYRRGTNNRFRRTSDWRHKHSRDPASGQPLGPLIRTVGGDELSELCDSAPALTSSAQITNSGVLASYNWLDQPDPRVLVPGAPPKWTPPRKAVQLKPDAGVYYRDKNASRYPAHPMEAAIRAVLLMQPSPSSELVDVVACGSTIGNLLRFVRGEDRPFRMLVDCVGGTVHFVRREASPTEVLRDVKGYGHTFPEAYTSWDAEVGSSASHQRILQYDFGGLKCIVRHEGDGYLSDKMKAFSESTEPHASTETNGIESLVAHMQAKTISTNMAASSSSLKVDPGGFNVPQAAVFDLKTRSIMRKGHDFLSEELPRLWVAQIPNFVLAYHSRGKFDDIEVIDVSSKIQEWQSSMQVELTKLTGLLQRIVKLARESPSGRLEINRVEPNELEIRDQIPGLSPVLSAETLHQWRIWLGVDGPADDSKSQGGDELGDSESDLAWSDGSGDFTACSKHCGYCGHCTY